MPTLPGRLIAAVLLLALVLAVPADAQPSATMDLPADLDRWALVYDQADATIFLDTTEIVQSEGRITAWT